MSKIKFSLKKLVQLIVNYYLKKKQLYNIYFYIFNQIEYFNTFLHDFEIWNHKLKKTWRKKYLYIFIIILQKIIGRSITVIIYL